MTIRAYHGTVSNIMFNQAPAFNLVPQASGHLRVHTNAMYQAPYRATWWLYPYGDMRPGGTTGGQNMDGLHTHFGHLDNHMNYNLHSVRRDGNAKLDLEYGLSGYQAVRWFGSEGLPLRLWRRYLFTLDLRPDSMVLYVRNDGGEATTLRADLPERGPHAGHLGWRLDNLRCYFGGLTVKEW